MVYNDGFQGQSRKREDNQESQIKIAVTLDRYDALKRTKRCLWWFQECKKQNQWGYWRNASALVNHKKSGRGPNNKVGMSTQQLSNYWGSNQWWKTKTDKWLWECFHVLCAETRLTWWAIVCFSWNSWLKDGLYQIQTERRCQCSLRMVKATLGGW